ncbi:putative histone-lysine n-methyltransferase [Phialemonium atrogriseum]|uniref:Histone-lysine n-methyltransferase n=1 Tax=Phialemonium atrogriseum TaxID=1093897 RepID=A0AAJ0C788_9PEZI|nr:putative histone-lysine n-methyltransferase [Phialemonium atrogriseum]KAK1768981.1 putative histone-lysine n-methyltransferase [Phialemonium atrogriseum]
MAELATLPTLSTLPTESSFSALSTESSSQVASLSSTPPTSVSPDSVSLASDHDTPKPANTTTPLLEGSCLLQEQQQYLQQEVEREQHVEEHGPSIAVQTLPEPPLQVKTEPEPELETRPELEPELDAGQQTPIAQAIIVAAQALTAPEPPSTGRSRRARGAAPPVYNLAKLSGTDIHGKRRANGDPVRERRRRTTTSNTLTGADALVRNGINALDLDWEIRGPSTPRSSRTTRKVKSSPKDELPARRPTRLSGAAVTGTLTAKMSALGKRSRKTFEKGLSRLSRELARLQDTDEFSHVDKRPVVHTVWSNGKFVDPREIEAEAAAPPPRKKAKTASSPEPEKKQEVAEKQEEGTKAGPAQTKGHVKKWLDKGLYAGQEAPADVFKGLTAQEKKKLAQIPELASGTKPNRSLPMPMFGGLRLLLTGRDFKLPYDVCNPLPPGQPKPTAYRTMTRNRFIGDAAAYWKKQPHFNDFQSKCVCKPEDGCDDQCQNRIMLYECDDTNCNVGRAHCTNRAFQSLQERTKQGGRFRIGVEVVKTGDRGYGVRSNRCFQPNQIIMEYTGEIITEEECERRMNEVYKENECYYLMSFDQNMIIDATTGSIARFVNHSCSPNSRMIKWIVSGQPRMALFAGDRPIMTGEELTYDYNFDPFSAKNVQKCLCGSPNCRGVLGPKSREPKAQKQAPKEDAGAAAGRKSSVKAGVKASKRKLKELLAGDSDDAAKSAKTKKRKIAKATGPGAAGLKAAKGAAAALKRSVSSISVSTKAALGSKKGGSTSGTPRRASTGGLKRYYGRKGGEVIRTSKAAIAVATSSRGAAGLKTGDGNKRTPKKKIVLSSSSSSPGKGSGRKVGKGTPSSASSIKKKKNSSHKKVATTTPNKPAAAASPLSSSSPRKRVPSRKVLEAAAAVPAALPASPAGSAAKSPKPRKGLELSRAARVRLVEDVD